MRIEAALSLLLLGSCLSTRPAPPKTAADAVLAKLDDFDIVLVGESPHRGRRIHHFYRELLRHPDFASRVDDILVEFGSARFQGVMDRFLLELEDVPLAELQHAWRDTTQLLVWDSPVYENFFRQVHELNVGLPENERVRVLLGDPPIEWEHVTTPDDLNASYDREGSYVEILEREVLERDRKALVFIGASHLLMRDAATDFVAASTPRSWLGHQLADQYPGQSATVYPFFGREHLAELMDVSALLAPSYIDLTTEPLGVQSFGPLAPEFSVKREVDGETRWVPLDSDDWPAMKVMVDALLYLGEEADDEEVAAISETYRDEIYVAELRRRAAIVDAMFGMAFMVPEVEAAVAR